jgi:hypothetical protein
VLGIRNPCKTYIRHYVLPATFVFLHAAMRVKVLPTWTCHVPAAICSTSSSESPAFVVRPTAVGIASMGAKSSNDHFYRLCPSCK